MSFTDDFRACLAQFIATDGWPQFNADRVASVRVSLAKPTDGQVLAYVAATDRYEAGAVIVGGAATFTSITLGTTPAVAGIIRLPNSQNIQWRNGANSADLSLRITSLDFLSTDAKFDVNNATDATTTSDGSFRTAGGAGIAKKLFVGSTVTVGAGTTSAPSLNIPQGVAPTSPTNGDVWMTSAGLYYRAGGVTVGPLGYWSA